MTVVAQNYDYASPIHFYICWANLWRWGCINESCLQLRPDLEQQPEETWEQQPEVQVQEEPQEEEQVNTSEKHFFPRFFGVFFLDTLYDNNTLVNKFGSNRTFSIKLAYEDWAMLMVQKSGKNHRWRWI